MFPSVPWINHLQPMGIPFPHFALDIGSRVQLEVFITLPWNESFLEIPVFPKSIGLSLVVTKNLN